MSIVSKDGLVKLGGLKVTALGCAIASCSAAFPALAAGTTAGTAILNTATLDYVVGGVAQAPITASNSVQVDRKVALTLTVQGSPTIVPPGKTGALLTLTLTNASNVTLDFDLKADDDQSPDFELSDTIKLFRDAPGVGSGTFGPEDAEVLYIDELAADTVVTIFVTADIPADRVTGQRSSVELTATAKEGGGAGVLGASLTETTGPNTVGVDTAFADTAGYADGVRDAIFGDIGIYEVLGAQIIVSQSMRIIADPQNGSSNPKAIPGATAEYCISVENGAGAAADNVSVTNILPGEVTFIANSINVGTSVSGGVCTGGAPGGTFANNTVEADLGTIPSSTSKGVSFRVSIN